MVFFLKRFYSFVGSVSYLYERLSVFVPSTNSFLCHSYCFALMIQFIHGKISFTSYLNGIIFDENCSLLLKNTLSSNEFI